MTEEPARLARIAADPRYRALVNARARLGWLLAGVVFACFMGFTLLVAFDKPLLATPVSPGAATSVGIPLGFAVILVAIATTGFYVARANSRFDAELAALLADHAA